MMTCAALAQAPDASAPQNPPPSSTVAASPQTPARPAGAIHGIVKSGNTPLPGVTITATNTLTGQKVTAWTDVDGSYSLQVPSNGRYVLRTQMAAFASATQEVLINAASHDATANLEPVLLSRAQQAAQVEQKQAAAIGRGFQTLSVLQSASSADLASNGGNDIVPSGISIPGLSAGGATESVSISGNNSSPFATMSSDEMRARFNEMRQSNGGGLGGFGGGFGGGGFGGGGGGGRGAFGRGFNFNQPHGSIYYSVGDSALNASPFSLTGQPVTKPGYLQQRFGITTGGPLKIPGIYKGSDKTFFFLNYNGSRGENPFDQFSTVPTLLERVGNFSQTIDPTTGQPVQIFNPATGTQFANNTITAISPVAKALLGYIPLPNLPGDTQNFHRVIAATSNSDDFNIRLIRSLGGTSAGPRPGGPRNSLTFGFHYHGASSDITNPFPSVGGSTSSRDFDIPIGYVRTFGKLTNNLRFDFNRSRTNTQNLYAFTQDAAGNAGITGISTGPFDWGLPTLSFKDLAELQDTNPSLVRDQTYSLSDNVVWNHAKHTWRWGGDFRRIQQNTEGDSNSRGSFIFSGLNTSQLSSNGTVTPGTGYDFADFLLGLPQQTSVQYGANNYHFRGNSWDLYVQDEWKLRGNLTLNLGVRYEYVSPFTEINNRIANLDLSPSVLNPALGTPQVAVVLPGATGPYNGSYPSTLVHPDRDNFAPRVGFAWKPLSKTVVRGGYGINYNTGAYQTIAQDLAFQPPFALSQTNIQSSAGALTLANGFPPVTPGTITNSYAVDPNYRLGYVQIRNFDIQQEIRPTLIVNLDYTGTKGSRLDILSDPNRDLTGIRIANAQAFNYEESAGSSSANAASVRVRKRLQDGISVGGTYTFSKSIDDASTIGGGTTSSGNSAGLGAGGTGPGGGGGGGGGSSNTGSAQVAQNPFDLAAERGLSSFNQTHRFTGDFLWELPFGHDRRWLSSAGAWRAILGDWQWSGDWTIASGLPFTPHIENSSGELNAGTNGTLRPDLTGESISISNPSVNQWFNTAAFVAPPTSPTGALLQYGNARRNSIIGPGSNVWDMAFTKVIPLKESRVLELRSQLTNVFNTPQFSSIDTNLSSQTFGRVIGVGSMRAVQMSARFRF